MFKIGAMADCFRLPVTDAIIKAAEMGLDGVQLYATHGEMEVDSISTGRIADFNRLIADKGMVLSALCGDFMSTGHIFSTELLIEKTKRVIDLGLKLGTNIVTSHIGNVDESLEKRNMLLDCFGQVAQYAQSMGTVFAVETGPESAISLKRFLDDISSKGIGVNLDPANLVMVADDDPVQAVYTLKDYLVHTHAKDGKKLTREQAKDLYGTDEEREHYYIEMPLGQGNVDYNNYISALRDIGYKGFLTIEREVGDNPIQDISHAMGFLKNILY